MNPQIEKLEKLAKEITDLKKEKSEFENELAECKSFTETRESRYNTIISDLERGKDVPEPDREFKTEYEAKEKRVKTLKKVISGLETTIEKTEQELEREKENYKNSVKARCEKEIPGVVQQWNDKVDELQLILNKILKLSNEYRLNFNHDSSLLSKMSENAFRCGNVTFARVNITGFADWNTRIGGLKLKIHSAISQE